MEFDFNTSHVIGKFSFMLKNKIRLKNFNTSHVIGKYNDTGDINSTGTEFQYISCNR